MPGPHKGVSTQHTNQQVLAKTRHQPSERDQQARERLRQKAKIKSCTYIQLGEKVLQTVHQTFEPDIPVILYSPFTGFSQHYNKHRYSASAICNTRRHQLHAHH